MATSQINGHSTLAAAAYSFVGKPYDPPDGTVQGGGKSMAVRDHAVSSLQLFITLVEGESTAASFGNCLDRKQSTSWRLIREWLSGTTQPTSSKDWAKQIIDSVNFNPVDLWERSLLFRSGIGNLEVSSYQFYLLMLFQMEFTSDIGGKEPSGNWMQSLATARRNAQNYATSQRLAHALFSTRRLTGSPKKLIAPLPLMEDGCPWLLSGSDEFQYPYYLWDTETDATIQSSDIVLFKEYSCISHTWGRWKLPSSVRLPNVPWKIPRNKVFDVKDLALILRRCAHRLRCRYLWLDLVCIPQGFGDTGLRNLARREMFRQSLIFRNAKTCVSWMNYIEDWGAERQTLDFMSQFYLTKSCPAAQYPRHQISFGSRPNAKEGLQLLMHPDHDKYFKAKCLRSFARSVLSAACDKLSRSQKNVKDQDQRARHQRRTFHASTRPQNEVQERQWKPSPWFSSLWTLQEAHIRPDMVLYNRFWEPLTDSAGSVFTLEMVWTVINTTEHILNQLRQQEYLAVQHDTQVQELKQRIMGGMQNTPKPQHSELGVDHCAHALCESARAIRQSSFTIDHLPLGVRQLFELCEPMCTTRKDGPSRAQILAQSNTRQCSDQRAPGVMGVLGLSELQIPEIAPKEDELVLGMYPLDFVYAAMKATGPDFFMARKVREVDSVPQHQLPTCTEPTTGSMLPFGRFDSIAMRGLDSVKIITLGSTDTAFHSSVLHWSLQLSGSFIVHHAAILASNDGVPRLAYGISAAWFLIRGGVYSAETGDVTTWVVSQSKRFRIVAVNVSRNCGVLLQSRDPDKDPMEFTKIGCYVLQGEQQAEEHPIDWLPTSRNINWVIV